MSGRRTASNPGAQSLARDELRRVLQGNASSFEACQEANYLVQTIKEAMRLYPLGADAHESATGIDGLRLNETQRFLQASRMRCLCCRCAGSSR
ncbi:cytochrome P450 [Achromobacter ruhlandii]|uniref:cytochrome P450 n=1 Tax=Achromobacter ruhlandii TaxID=72557 RepID=UPI0012E899A4|nr:cytochrome P450 [Achromobacter ruhlandii]